MENKLFSIFKKPVFLYLLPLFWVLHGFIENFGLIPLKDILLLWLWYTGIAVFLSALCWLFYRNFQKANLLSFLLLCFQFFFGSIQDFLKNNFAGSILSKYSFILPLATIVFLVVIVLLKKQKRPLTKTVFYLNTLFFVLISIDIFILFTGFMRRTNNISFVSLAPCPGCKKPDIYLLIADSYPGHREFKELMNFDNTAFENELRKKGFYIVDNSSSNYNFTGFSVASMLNMNYLHGLTGSNSSKNDIFIYSNTISQSQLPLFFKAIGYEFYNYSIFEFKESPSQIIATVMSSKTRLITSQTFTRRIIRDMGYHLATTLKIPFFVNRIKTAEMRNNNLLYENTWNVAGKRTKPKFVYTHLMMPHYPYFYDQDGNKVPQDSLTGARAFDQTAFVHYVQYCNKKILALVDHINKASSEPPIIIVMGDHGFREFRDSVDKKYYFMNLNAVYFPNGDYSGFYKGMSNINQFRVLLNSQFNQKLPLLKDSSSFLSE